MASILNFFMALIILGIIFVVGFVLALGICALVYFFVILKKVPEDTYKKMYEEYIEEAIINKPSELSELVRYPAPFFGRLLAQLNGIKASGNDEKFIGEIKEELNLIKNNISDKSGVFMGNIVGYNRVDLMTAVNDIDVETLGKKRKMSDDAIKELKDKKEELQSLLGKCGNYLTFIVYEREVPSFIFFTKKIRHGLFAFEDQAIIDKNNGRIIALGEGTSRIGMYFQLISGYRDRVEVVLLHLITTSRIRLTTTLDGNLISIVNKSINLDTAFVKLAELAIGNRTNSGGGGVSEVKK